MVIGIGKCMAQATGFHGSGWIFELIILAMFFLIVYWIVKSSTKSESAKEILNRRYTAGEISRKEFLELKKEIFEEH